MFPPLQTPNVVPLETLDLTKIHQTIGVAKRDLAHGGKPLTVGGKLYERGIGTHAESYFRLSLGGKARRFKAMVGLDDAGERFWGPASGSGWRATARSSPRPAPCAAGAPPCPWRPTSPA